MSDENERSVASTGSVDAPVAWAVLGKGEIAGHVIGLDHTSIEARARVERMVGWGEISTADKVQVVPLYRQPQPTLTPEERQALERLCYDASDMIANDQRDSGCHWEEEMYAVAMTRALLDRLG